MNDMSSVIVPKSDQINADDFIAGPQNITIRDVQIRGGQEQPVSIYFEGSDKAFRPCKSMSRVLVQAWGPDAKVYVGRSLTLYRDPSVKWGGMEVGGIRISHMSNIDGKMVLQLTATKGQRKPHVVMPLVEQKQTTEDRAAKWASAFTAKLEAATDRVDLEKLIEDASARLDELKSKCTELHTKCSTAIDEARAKFAPEGKPDSETGEAFTGDDMFADEPADLPSF